MIGLDVKYLIALGTLEGIGPKKVFAVGELSQEKSSLAHQRQTETDLNIWPLANVNARELPVN